MFATAPEKGVAMISPRCLEIWLGLRVPSIGISVENAISA